MEYLMSPKARERPACRPNVRLIPREKRAGQPTRCYSVARWRRPISHDVCISPIFRMHYPGCCGHSPKLVALYQITCKL